MSRNNPYKSYNAAYKANKHQPLATMNPMPASSAADLQKQADQSLGGEVINEFPNHLFVPSSAQSVNILRLANVPSGTTTDLIVFTAIKGTKTKFIGYAVFCDALMFSLINFVPTVNGKRIFPFHGDPQLNYKIGLGLGPDFSNNNLVPCQLDMQPGDVLRWTFTNNDTVDVAAGVRMIGYVDSTTLNTIGRVGG